MDTITLTEMNPTEQMETPTTEQNPQVPTDTEALTLEIQNLTTEIQSLNGQIVILQTDLKNLNTPKSLTESIDYREQLDVITNRLDLLTTDFTLFFAGTVVIFVIFILYSAVRAFLVN
ncbi:MAG: hypothetical protein RR233_06310 [Clostridiales bacterium]